MPSSRPKSDSPRSGNGAEAARGRGSRTPPKPDIEDGLSFHSVAFLEARYQDYLRDPQSIGPEWRDYFEGYAPAAVPMISRPSLPRRSLFNPAPVDGEVAGRRDALRTAVLQERVDQLVRNYRVRGHRIAQLDPLQQPWAIPPELDPAYYGFTEGDLDRPFSTTIARGAELRTLRDILERLRSTYCRRIGAQFMHIDDLSVREWLQQRMEGTENRIQLSRDEQLRILTRLTDAVVFEEFIQKKYVGAKSFSLEGAESLIPLLDLAIERAGEQGIREIVFGMAHRGRLNVLANIMGKSPKDIFREFEDVDPELHVGRGDVKYHLGYSNDWTTTSGHRLHLSLCFNPSHLEFVDPVALGRMRAKQDRFGDRQRRAGMVLLIHGDAAFSGEGIVQETLNLSELSAYTVGGTIHVLVNNQLGFTTPPEEGRSSTYATDVAKMLQIPIFHVNGEDPEAVAQVIQLAMEFRQAFQRDVVIDMYCYRRHGHNEADDPSLTQPVMYRKMEEIQPVRESYLNRLLKFGDLTREDADRIAEERRQYLERELSAARSKEYVPRRESLGGVWADYWGGPATEADEVDATVDRDRLAELLAGLTRLPDDFRPQRRIERGLKARKEMADGQRPLDWSAGEALAFATLSCEHVRVRMSGQDTARGTFSQRHAILFDANDGHPYMPLAHLDLEQGPIEICNSPLSEAAVCGFEYGYSLDCPEGLVIWEAQFGDFANAAQVIIDQFLASAEDKWQRLSGLVLLLPHGFEGQGPEHSSARLERFLMLAADDNLQIAYPTTPAQYFHVLRRQALRRWRKPLVVMTPKSLLRHKRAVSTLDDCAQGRFQPVLGDNADVPPQDVRHVLLCSGKVYYELLGKREEIDRRDVAILRLEQLWPPASARLCDALAAYPDGTPVVWVQEEPENMGAWRCLRLRFGDELFGRLPFSGVSRPASASPATGSGRSHELEQEKLIARAFGEVSME